MATASQIELVRLSIYDVDSSNYDFTDSQIETFIDLKNSVNYACLKLLQVLKAKLRTQLLESDTTGTEQTKIASMESRRKLIDNLIEIYQKEWDSENKNNTGVYIDTVKPTVCGGDV